MAKKNKAGKLEYQCAFEYRGLKWLVLEIVLFSVFFELVFTYFNVTGNNSKDDVPFAPVISDSMWQVIFYVTMLVGFFGVAYVIFGDRKDFNGLYALRSMPIDTKYIIISKLGVSIVAMLGIYGSQLLSFMFAWSLFTDKIPVGKRETHALNYALVKDPFIYASFPSNVGDLLVNVVAIIVLVIGFSYLLYSLKTRITNKILLGGIYFIANLLLVILLAILGVRVPFIASVAKGNASDVAIPLAIILITYFAIMVTMIRRMYREFIYE